jgi:hypothetical protein
VPLPAKRPPRLLPFGALLLGALLACASGAAAQDVPAPFDLPWTDTPPVLRDGAVRVAAVGQPDERIGRFAARRASARTDGRRRALRALHGWADDALARVRATPREAQRVHAALEAAARVDGVRPLVDAGAVVVLAVDPAALRAACDREGLPWAR